ncbi:uncharacterized protein PHALS_05932 [Plasmopara halstedii]|uniref:Uncharacterized protein n=1 Tax=Plasmopara halstedii TaxID=4781 RepID=A0A0P1ABR0_PLAHL|nr:uncharacterized protein PHALS_05932 [Plasmopara halstedii]CEG37882.1 hypothetical protein PHALS_05932 [Plasmopara halstedii]|eukprot:XP_024574251.1 hypothetical protein PHALS_05932 [Plasmopara halstedii]
MEITLSGSSQAWRQRHARGKDTSTPNCHSREKLAVERRQRQAESPTQPVQQEMMAPAKSDGDKEDNTSVWSSPQIKALKQSATNLYIESSNDHMSTDDHEERCRSKKHPRWSIHHQLRHCIRRRRILSLDLKRWDKFLLRFGSMWSQWGLATSHSRLHHCNQQGVVSVVPTSYPNPHSRTISQEAVAPHDVVDGVFVGATLADERCIDATRQGGGILGCKCERDPEDWSLNVEGDEITAG